MATPKRDEIRQWEIQSLCDLEMAKDAMALGFKRRLEAGAAVQPGPYYLEPDTDTMEDLEEDLREYQTSGFTCIGFTDVGFNPKARPARAGRLDRAGRR